MFNVYFIMQMLYSLFNINQRSIPVFVLVPIAIIVYIMNIILFNNKDKSKLVIKEFTEESKKRKILGNEFLAFYKIISICLIFVASYFKDNL